MSSNVAKRNYCWLTHLPKTEQNSNRSEISIFQSNPLKVLYKHWGGGRHPYLNPSPPRSTVDRVNLWFPGQKEQNEHVDHRNLSQVGQIHNRSSHMQHRFRWENAINDNWSTIDKSIYHDNRTPRAMSFSSAVTILLFHLRTHENPYFATCFFVKVNI